MMQTLLPEARARLVEVVPGDLSQGVNVILRRDLMFLLSKVGF